MVPVNGNYEEAKVTPKLDGTAQIESLESEYKKIVVLADYLRVTKTVPVITMPENVLMKKSVSFFFLFISGFFMLYFGISDGLKRWRVRKLIDMSEKSNEAKKAP